MAGDVGVSGAGGNEGTWAVDSSQSSPLNRAFVDYLTDLSALVKAAGHTMTVAFSQELLAPPDSNDAAPESVTFGFFNYLGTGYAHYITIGSKTYTHLQVATDGSGDIATAPCCAHQCREWRPECRRLGEREQRHTHSQMHWRRFVRCVRWERAGHSQVWSLGASDSLTEHRFSPRPGSDRGAPGWSRR